MFGFGNKKEEKESYFYFDVVGTSYNNDNGSNRNDIILQYTTEGDVAHLEFYSYKGDLACKVFIEDDKGEKVQIGHAPADEVADIYLFVTQDKSLNIAIDEVDKSDEEDCYASIQITAR